MSNSNLTLLGKRENAVFILTPLYLVLFYFFDKLYGSDILGLSLFLRIPYVIAWVVAVVSVLRFFRRIVLPSKILEYDSMNLYINKGLKGTQMIPWSDIRSVDNLQVYGDFRAIFGGLHRHALPGKIRDMFVTIWNLSVTGIIVINCKNELVRVHGIKNAKEVRNEIHKIITQKRKNIDKGFKLR